MQKISIFTTISDWDNNHWQESLRSYLDLADEVVVVDGSVDKIENDNPFMPSMTAGVFYIGKELIQIANKWPEEFSFDFIGQQFQRGYEACTGDWVIHCDIDYVFHEDDFKEIREQLKMIHSDTPVLSMYKYQFILPDRFVLKSRTPMIVNRKYGDRIKFNSGGDLCQPSLDGEQVINPPCLTIPFYNYEHLIKTEEVLRNDIGRMERAYRRTFNKSLYGEDCFDGFMKMVTGRIKRHGETIGLRQHPKYIQETIKNLKPKQFGYDNFGNIKCTYF